MTRSTRKPSAAHARRKREQLLAHREQPPALPEELEESLITYRPREVDDTTWREIRPLLLAVMRRSQLTSVPSLRQRCADVVRLARWARSVGRELTLEVVMTPEVIEEFILTGCVDEPDSSRSTRRSRLQGLARAANPTAMPRRTQLAHVSVQPPYTDLEMAALVRLARHQPSGSLRRQMCACVGLGAGAGLDSGDLGDLRARHVIDHGDDGIIIDVPGSRTRKAVVRSAYEDLVRTGVAGLRSNDLVIGQKSGRRTVAPKVFENAVILGDPPKPSQPRLRSTWLAALITSRVPLVTILQAAGLTSARTITDLATMLPEADIDEAVALLRDARGGDRR